MAASMDTIEIYDMPRAVFNARRNGIWRFKIMVSRIIEVNRPLNIANSMIHSTGQSIPLI